MLAHCEPCNSLFVYLIALLVFATNNNVDVNALPAAATQNYESNNNYSFHYYYNLTLADGKLADESNSSGPAKNFKLNLQNHLPIIMELNDKANLTAITWAHAVNSQSELNEALESDINMIEADIVLGKLNNTGDDMPVMAHPPANSSDLTLTEFLLRILEHNEEHGEDAKGVKLDFKSIEVFEGSLDILSELLPLMSHPVWLNADIISGPVNQSDTVPVDPARFFAGAAKFESAVLSIGWTTRWGANYTEGAYTAQEIDEMLLAIKNNNVTEKQHPITFPVRAGIAANSLDQLHRLVAAVNETNESSLTIWSSANDFVDVQKLRKLIFSFGFDRVYLDVPDELANQLELSRADTNDAPRRLPSLLSFSMVSACLYLASMWLSRVRL
ncbi:protein FAM151B isoform X1 [Ceratitis capitata]|uniref:protein FAM151B isoform X1 n=1 Tax=Ceratitis capitata TaxID=7213 RepID=UPI0006188F45|nr:protein FAM151B isoform X1 [Ceratitis capitata]